MKSFFLQFVCLVLLHNADANGSDSSENQLNSPVKLSCPKQTTLSGFSWKQAFISGRVTPICQVGKEITCQSTYSKTADANEEYLSADCKDGSNFIKSATIGISDGRPNSLSVVCCSVPDSGSSTPPFQKHSLFQQNIKLDCGAGAAMQKLTIKGDDTSTEVIARCVELNQN